MKLLVIGKPKDAMTTLPPGLIRQLWETSLVALGQQKGAGRFLEGYSSPTGHAIAILDYKDADEWMKEQTSVPIVRYYDWEVYPLAHLEEGMNSLLGSLKAAERLMSATAK